MEWELVRLIVGVVTFILQIVILVFLIKIVKLRSPKKAKHAEGTKGSFDNLVGRSSPAISINEARSAMGMKELQTTVFDMNGQKWDLTDKEFAAIGRPYKDLGTLDDIEVLQLMAYRDMVKNS